MKVNKKKPTNKQAIAWKRNWHIRQLRAFFHLVPPPVSPVVKKQIQQLVDSEIMRLGAESEILREESRGRDLEESLKSLDNSMGEQSAKNV